MNDPIAQRSQRLEMSLFSGTCVRADRYETRADGITQQTFPRAAMTFIAAVFKPQIRRMTK
jgi:hypothetical protein